MSFGIYDHDHENDVIYFARTNFRNSMRKFGIKTDDRRRHTYIIGKTGVGKTTLIENMILSDIYLNHGVAIVDPHGDSAETVLNYIPNHRINDVVYFNPADVDNPVGFNVLEAVDDDHRHLIASGLMGVFKKIWPDVWSPRMEHIMNNCILTLLENPGNTLLGINRILVDRDFRRRMVSNLQDPVVKSFWITEFEQWQDKFRSEAIAPIQNKVGQFLSTSLVRNIVAQVKSTINPREIMDGGKILIMNLSKGRIGEDSSRLLGGLVITKLQLSAMERVDMLEPKRRDFYLFIDEFQNFATESFANILSEARKYHLNLIMAHQYIEQLDETVVAAVFGNVGTLISFRIGATDALKLVTEFAPRFTEEDLVNLPKYNIYLKLMIDGVASESFSATTLPPIAFETGNAEKIIARSRELYTHPKNVVHNKIMKWSETKMEPEGEVPGMPADAPGKKKSKKPLFDYDCTRCGKHMSIPVELDRNRPIYCEDCIEIVREEKKKGTYKEPKIKKETKSPKMVEGEIVKKELPGVEVGLDALNKSHDKPKEQPKKDDQPKQDKKSNQESKKDSDSVSLPSEGTPPPKKKRKRKKKKPSRFQQDDSKNKPKVLKGEEDIFPW